LPREAEQIFVNIAASSDDGDDTSMSKRELVQIHGGDFGYFKKLVTIFL
jgi:hypothetical protein